jgi:hypothetical protein
MKKYLAPVLFTAVIAAGNVWLWLILRDIEQEISWVVFAVVWFNLIIGWFTFRRQMVLTYIFFAVALILELVLLVDKFWIMGRGL